MNAPTTKAYTIIAWLCSWLRPDTPMIQSMPLESTFEGALVRRFSGAMSLTSIRSAGMTALRKVRSALGGTTVALTYHRISDTPLDPQMLSISPERFDEHIAAFSKRYNIITAEVLVRALSENRRVPDRSLVITMDDGYADCFTEALPILERHGAVATAFVCSGFVDGGREYWWDELEKLLLVPRELPAELVVEHGGRRFGGPVSAEGRMLDDATARSFEGWNYTHEPFHARLRKYLAFSKVLAPLSSDDRESVLVQLREQLGVESSVRESKRSLTREEVRVLGTGSVIEIGAHTVTHQNLAQRTVGEQRAEIFGCRDALAQMCGSAPVSFSYPYGTRGTFSEETIGLVDEAGFLGAFTTELGSPLPWGSASRLTDPYRIPRSATVDVSAGEMVALIDKRMGL